MNDEMKVVARSIVNVAELPFSKQQVLEVFIKAVNECKRQQLILGGVLRLKKLSQTKILVTKQSQELAVSAVKSKTSKANNLDHGFKRL